MYIEMCCSVMKAIRDQELSVLEALSKSLVNLKSSYNIITTMKPLIGSI